MKAAIIALLAIALAGCKTAKKATDIQASSTSEITDTTRVNIGTHHDFSLEVRADSAATSRQDSTHTSAERSGCAVIEFVEGGGWVHRDSAGGVTYGGVQRITGTAQERRQGTHTSAEGGQQVNTTVNVADADSARLERSNGITENEHADLKQHEQQATPQRWYEPPLIALGALCCIAALLWVLFLCIKRRR